MILAILGNLHPTTQRLLLAQALRSIGQGVTVVGLALYLHALYWGGVAICLVLSRSSFFGEGLSLRVGLSSDWLRRKPFLLNPMFRHLQAWRSTAWVERLTEVFP
jgi:hypothetical protein